MTFTPSQHMLTAEELRRTLDKRAELGDDRLFQLLRELADADLMWSYPPDIGDLVSRAGKLVELLNESEHQHGGLLTTNMLNAKNQLALELSRWK